MKTFLASILLTLAVLTAPLAHAGGCGMLLCGAGSSGGGAPSAFSLTYKSTASATTGTVVDYGTMTYGAGNTRVVLVSEAYTASAISGVTIGGVALAQISGAQAQAGTSNFYNDVWQSTGPLSGSSGDVVVTYGSGGILFNSTVSLYNLVTTTPTGTATPGGTVLFGTTVSASPTIPSGGGALVAVASYNGTAISSITNGAVDDTYTGGGANQTYGHATSTGSITITGNYPSSDVLVMTVVAWGP